jgi:hypothetical protein
VTGGENITTFPPSLDGFDLEDLPVLNRISDAFRRPRGPAPALALARGTERWPIPTRPIRLGRLPECDVVIPGDEVSRVHAWIVPTPAGPLLVDQGRHGTSVNGEPVRGPRLLGPGDVVSIGEAAFLVEAHALSATPPQGRPGNLVRRWLSRYGPSEILGTVAAVASAVLVERMTGSIVAAAYAGALAETVAFYGVMFLRECVRAAHQAGARGRPFAAKDFLTVGGNLVLEFGVAEALDLVVIRPLLMGVGLRWVGGQLGALVGKLAADLVFYGPVLTIYEWRLAEGTARVEERRRRTTAAHVAPPGP